MQTQDGKSKLTAEGSAILRLLLSEGANANYRTAGGKSALQLARKYRALDLATLLQRAGARH